MLKLCNPLKPYRIFIVTFIELQAGAWRLQSGKMSADRPDDEQDLPGKSGEENRIQVQLEFLPLGRYFELVSLLIPKSSVAHG